jgi:hypothetical protein
MIARRSVSLALVWLCAVAGALVWCGAPALAQREHEFSKAFGSEGSGDGQLLRPGALAVSEIGPDAGDVYVVDRGNGRVEIFSATGTYVGQFNGGEAPTGAFSWTDIEKRLAFFEVPVGGGIAVDNSTNPLDPSAGDVYVLDMGHDVVDKFSPSGLYIGQLKGVSAATPFTHLHGVAVDANGALWVEAGEVPQNLFEFNDAVANAYIAERPVRFRPKAEKLPNVLGDIGLAFDSEGNSYAGYQPSVGIEQHPFTGLAKFNGAGTLLAEELDSGEEITGVAVDRSSNDVYVDNETSIATFGPSESLVERFGSPQLNVSEGVAVDSATGTVYASDATGQAVDVFTAFIVPDVTTGSVSGLGETSATLGGIVDPDGLVVTSCVFEYGTTESESYGQSEPCSTSPGSGSDPVAVSAELKGLQPLTKYHYRLVVSNSNGSNMGQGHAFETPVPDALSEEGVSDVSSDGAQFNALVNPGGSDTKFLFEYGTSVAYGESVPTPDGALGAGTRVEPVSVRAQGLLPQTTYHVRMVASNALGTMYGPDETFTTQAGGGAFALPDGRQWELVSPPNKYGAAVEPIPRVGLVEAAEDGSAIAYISNGPVVASPAGNPSPAGATQILSRRVVGGWLTEDIATPHDSTSGASNRPEYFSFSSDLSQALVAPEDETPLSPEATEKTVYLREDDTGGYLPLVTAGNVPGGTRFGNSRPEEGVNAVMGTPDLSHILVTSKYALTSNAVPQPAGERENIYEWVDGRLTLVNVLPAPNGKANPYGGQIGESTEDVRHALSNDGSRIFWGEEEAGPLYMTDTATGNSVQVDAPAPGVSPPPKFGGRFQIASATGSMVFFLEDEPLTADSDLPPLAEGAASNDLYVYDTEAKILTDLTGSEHLAGGELADVQDMVVGASEEGSVVYFVATGVLAEGAQAGADNLYVDSRTGSTWSGPRLVAVLSPDDSPAWGREEPLGRHRPIYLASRVSPNGRFLAFMSDNSLTGYDNRDASSGHPDEEVFLYDEARGHLTCVSCNPTGARPTGVAANASLLSNRADAWQVGHWLAADIPSWDSVTEPGLAPYQPRYLTDDGRLFFDSFDSLVPQDTNGKADVYEYEPERVGSCEGQDGCVSLISSGTSGEESALLDASGTGRGGEEGEDVFFLTAARLTAQDYDTSFDVYDAHACSSAVSCPNEPVSPPECSSGDSCKAAPSLQPAIFGAPASATFSGAGNLPAPPPAAVAPKKGGGKKSAKHKGKQKRSRKRKARRSRAHKGASVRIGGAGKRRGR